MSLEHEFIEKLNELLMDDTEENNNKLIATIKNYKFNVNNPIRYNGKNQFPLFICAGFLLKNEILQTLLDKGANINAIDEDSNNILGYLITTIIEEDRDEDEDEIIMTFDFLMRKGANIYYINSVSDLSIFDLIVELSNYSDMDNFFEYISNLKNKYYLSLLNSIFSKIGLLFTLTIVNEEYSTFEITPEDCNTEYGLKILIDEEGDLNIQLLSNCKKKKGTDILNLIKKFACKSKIKINNVYLEDAQSLIIDHEKDLTIQHIAILDIAVNGESWYNKMGFYKTDANPTEDKIINMEKSKKPLSSVLKSKLIQRFKEAFIMDSDIDVNNSIKNIFTIIKSDYLKNKTKEITKTQCNIISVVLKNLSKYYDYDATLNYNPSNSSKSTQSKSSLTQSKSSLTRRRSFDSWKPKSSKSRKIYNSY